MPCPTIAAAKPSLLVLFALSFSQDPKTLPMSSRNHYPTLLPIRSFSQSYFGKAKPTSRGVTNEISESRSGLVCPPVLYHLPLYLNQYLEYHTLVSYTFDSIPSIPPIPPVPQYLSTSSTSVPPVLRYLRCNTLYSRLIASLQPALLPWYPSTSVGALPCR